MTGTCPFDSYGNLSVVYKVMSDVRPERPTNTVTLSLSDVVWRIITDCWCHQRDQRPTVGVVLDRLNEAAGSWDPPGLVVNSGATSEFVRAMICFRTLLVLSAFCLSC